MKNRRSERGGGDRVPRGPGFGVQSHQGGRGKEAKEARERGRGQGSDVQRVTAFGAQSHQAGRGKEATEARERGRPCGPTVRRNIGNTNLLLNQRVSSNKTLDRGVRPKKLWTTVCLGFQFLSHFSYIYIYIYIFI
jgi:hypothetical protein